MWSELSYEKYKEEQLHIMIDLALIPVTIIYNRPKPLYFESYTIKNRAYQAVSAD